jgi:hypothetical protein
MPIKIVFDTNILFNRWYLDGPQFDLLRRHVASGRSTVTIPAIVVLELKNHYLKIVSEHLGAVQKLNPMLPEGYEPISLATPSDLAEDYVKQLRSRIAELGFREAPFTDILHESIVERAITRRRPFKDSGSGYQDCLIWETILQSVTDKVDVTYFVTTNHKDFAADDRQSLHPDLLEDVRRRGITEDRIQYVPDLKTLIDSHITPDMPAVESAEKLAALSARLLDDDILRDWISENSTQIMKELNKGESRFLDSVVQEAETVEVNNLEYPESFEIDSISAIDDKTAVVIGRAEVDANVTFLLFRNEYMILDPPFPFSAMGSSWNDHYIPAEIQLRLTLRFVFSVSLETDEVLDFEVEDETQLSGYCRRCGAIQYNEGAEKCGSCNRPFF